MKLRVHPLDYPQDSADLFERFADDPWAVFLDSAKLDRFDIIAAAPSATLVSRGLLSEISDSSGSRTHSSESPWVLLRQMLGPCQQVPSESPLPGCLIGYFGYDLARRWEPLSDRHDRADPFPDLAFARYDWLLVVDHQDQQAHLYARADAVSPGRWSALIERLQQAPSASRGKPLRALGSVQATPDWPNYRTAFARLQTYIRDGDCYQANLARRFQAHVIGDSWQGYRRLRACSPAPFGGYLNLPDGQLLCNSPESFLQLRAGRVSTSPIKGTRPRHLSPERDAAALAELQASSKDRAENLMIVDLLRNDLGRCCAYGSISVDQLFRPASFANVHHLISDISGQLRPDADALDLMASCFPGGSITGAPKRRAMQIIEELEPARRGPYCGSLAYLGPDGRLASNILIRSLTRQADQAWFWAGGGIVADSDAAHEFQETQHKASALLGLLLQTDEFTS